MLNNWINQDIIGDCITKNHTDQTERERGDRGLGQTVKWIYFTRPDSEDYYYYCENYIDHRPTRCYLLAITVDIS